MPMRDIPVPTIQPDEVLIRVAYSGICGSELSGYVGKNALRKPPLIMGHEFSGWIEAIGSAVTRSDLRVEMEVTANPLLSCGQCAYCLAGRQNLCPDRKLLSASLPGSNAEYVAVRASTLHALPADMPLTTGALVEPAACALRAAKLAQPTPERAALVVGAGPIGLLTIQALKDRGSKTIYAADTNPRRLEMAASLGATPVALDDIRKSVDIAIDAVGVPAVRAGCVAATRSGGRVVWVGLHDANATLDVNDLIRREIESVGSFAYTALDFADALHALAEGRLGLPIAWTLIEPLERGAACFEALIDGASTAKIWLQP
ncbi:MAG: alcohol dehydrogenase catalytic domain-containing protein [Chloroflexota bacterium]|nr:alcohol dehydrogenase catalytic domain-containing protein [Chloroflexota bacterium]